MQLTGNQILWSGIITNLVDEAIQQQGVDVRVKKISVVGGSEGNHGYVPTKGKTLAPKTTELPPINMGDGKEVPL